MLIAQRVIAFRESRGWTQDDLARQLGISRTTVLRWETGTSLPSVEAATALENLGIGPVAETDTKLATISPSTNLITHAGSAKTTVRSLRLGDDLYPVVPSPYISNAPPNQVAFYDQLLKLQESRTLPSSAAEYAQRLAGIASIPSLGVVPAQFVLERPSERASQWNANYGAHGWHRYVGRFPPHLVRAVINHFALRPGDTVLDPFAGSGTTLVEARLMGLNAIGIEVSPLSALMCRVKGQFPPDPTIPIALSEGLREFFANRASSYATATAGGAATHSSVLARPGNSVRAFENVEKWFTPEALLGTSIVLEYALALSGMSRDLVLLALSSQMRRIGNVDVDVIRAEYRKTPRSSVDVLGLVTKALEKIGSSIARSLSSHHASVSGPLSVVVHEGDLRTVALPTGVADAIITSPPYGVESLSYLRTHLLSYRALEAVLSHGPYRPGPGHIGSEYLEQTSPRAEYRGVYCSPTLAGFTQSLSDDSKGRLQQRRATQTMQYFDDMLQCAELFKRWLRPAGKLAFVIGDKRLGNTMVPTIKIVTELFAYVGLSQYAAIDHKLKWNNSNSEVPWQERTIQRESVLLFES